MMKGLFKLLKEGEKSGKPFATNTINGFDILTI